MKYRKLRITWSVAWGLICLWLVAMYLRSYNTEDFYEWSWHERDYGLYSISGEISFQRMMVFSVPFGAHGGSIPARPRDEFSAPPQHSIVGVNWSVFDRGWCTGASYIFVTVFGVATGGLPWIAWTPRFRLRTLLIATTLVATVLGLIMCLP